MKNRKIYTLILFLTGLVSFSCSNNINAQKSSNQINVNASNANIAKSDVNEIEKSEITEIVQKSIDYEKLQKYYHIQTNPERKPLNILKNSVITEKLNLTKFEKDVLFGTCEELKNKPYIEFVKLDVSSEKAMAVFRYYIEGVEVNLDFEKKNNKWEISKDSLVEKKFTDKSCNKTE